MLFPLSQAHPTGPTHSGWRLASCSSCHPFATQHQGRFTLFQCLECHGRNGATLLSTGHTSHGLANGYDCWSCHDPMATPHVADLAAGTCALCHGGNGATSLTAGHFVVGNGRVRCASCHPAITTHQGRFQPEDCGRCHQVTDAPRRPDPHYVSACTSCHGDGAASWNEATHMDLAAESPGTCAGCHPFST